MHAPAGTAGLQRHKWTLLARLAPWLIAAFAVLLYAPTLGAGFTYDDHLAIEGHPGVREPSWRMTLATPFWGPAESVRMSMWRPLVTASFAANAAASRSSGTPLDPLPFHVTNLAIFAAAILLFWRLASQLGLSLAGRVAATLLFAVHPLQTEDVASLVARADLLCAIAGLAYLTAVVRGRALGMALWLALALLCKETALILPGVAMLWWYAQWLTRHEPPPLHRRFVLVHMVVLVAWLAARIAIVGALTPAAQGVVENPLMAFGLGGRLFGAVAVTWLLLQRLLLGGPLNTDYGLGFFPPPALSASAAVGLCALLLLLAGVVLALRRSPRVAVALGLIAGPLCLLSHVLVPVTTAFADRLWPLAVAGACLGAGILAERLFAAAPRAAPAIVAAMALFCVRSVLAVQQRLPDWQDDAHVFEAMVQSAPGAYRANVNSAAIALARGQGDLARKRLQTALALHQDGAPAWLSLARVECAAGRADAARRALAGARSHGGATDKWFAVACTLGVRFESPEAALVTCREALDLAHRSGPTVDPEIPMWLAIACERAGDESCASRHMAEAERLHAAAPSATPQVALNAGVFYARRGEDLRAWTLLAAVDPAVSARRDVLQMRAALCDRLAARAEQAPGDARLRAALRVCARLRAR